MLPLAHQRPHAGTHTASPLLSVLFGGYSPDLSALPVRETDLPTHTLVTHTRFSL
ncbi:hypothetical protein SAMN02745181_0392 [Rubritalea squalenifaciens DSM 18772]|uniref:Uncharacterized protein n=1 Tax=Rubritalea squalenifaciens DSM 18772 TaxID=1123071 RepID=A0A1M6C5D0_9BACT|nr:hypothetical protein SAMN02745181_0392 [Rubritalea squalenifaciens DSM 18772]